MSLSFPFRAPFAGTTPVLQDALGVREIALMSENLRLAPGREVELWRRTTRTKLGLRIYGRCRVRAGRTTGSLCPGR